MSKTKSYPIYGQHTGRRIGTGYIKEHEPNNPMREKWICSACGHVNSLIDDNVCWRCMDRALAADAKKLADIA